MREALKLGLDQGAVGLSSGLDYVPSMWADAGELASLCEVVAAAGGVYVTHMRGYDERSPTGFAEVAEIARRSDARVHISHLMGQAERHLPVVDQLLADGIDVSFDSYPYLAGCTTLAMLGLPARLQERGPEQTLALLSDAAVVDGLRQDWFPDLSRKIGAFRLTYIAAPGREHLEGASIYEACDTLGLDLADLVCTLLVENRLSVGVVEPNGLSDDDLRATHRHPLHMAGSDGIYMGSHPHPRGWGRSRATSAATGATAVTSNGAMRLAIWPPRRPSGLASAIGGGSQSVSVQTWSYSTQPRSSTPRASSIHGRWRWVCSTCSSTEWPLWSTDGPPARRQAVPCTGAAERKNAARVHTKGEP